MPYCCRVFTVAFWLAAAVLLFASGCGQEPTSQIEFPEHPQLKLGFTTQNFTEALPVSVDNKKTLIDYAAEHGYAWIELRDADASLTVDDCEELAAYAQKKDIEVAYSTQRALLDPDFWDVFSSGLECAPKFDGPGTIRALASGQKFIENEEKQGYTATELDSLVARANRAADMADEHDLQLVVENALDPLTGEGESYYGLDDFFERANPNVGWQIDTGNPFGVARVPATAEEARSFLKTHIDRLHYIHLKSSQEGEPQPTLGPNPLEFGFVFDQLAQHDVPYIALELSAPETLETAKQNHQQSLDFLRQEEFIEIR